MEFPFVDPDESRLIAAVAHRDSQAFQELYQRYIPLICKVWYQFRLPTLSLEDWKQEAAIVLYRSACRFKQQDVCFCSYLRQSFLNRIRDIYRQQAAKKRVPFGCLNYLAEEGFSECDRMVDSRLRPDEVYRLRTSYSRFLHDCSPLERHIFLYINQGLSIQETAMIEKCSLRKVRSALERARKKLRDSLN